MRSLVFASFVLLLAGCSGSSPESGGDAGADAPSADVSPSDDARSSDAAPSDASSDAAVDTGPVRVPKNHRPGDTTCPATRAPGTLAPGCADAGFTTGDCYADSDCTKGTNGRCNVGANIVSACADFCSYDTCFSDKDCTANVPCDCRASASDNAANACMTGSNCRVDADCGPNGFCSPSGVSNCSKAYFCHTPADFCIDDSDCVGKVPPGETPACNYVNQAWRCGSTCSLPQ
jgi:hypothetical protein